jgi:hypothetical protein
MYGPIGKAVRLNLSTAEVSHREVVSHHLSPSVPILHAAATHGAVYGPCLLRIQVRHSRACSSSIPTGRWRWLVTIAGF